MQITTVMHIVAGGLALVSGFVALFAAKGASLHRRSGMVFVYAMLVMSLSGAGIAALTGVESSVIGGLFTAYLVFTAWTTIRRPASRGRWMDTGAMLVGLTVGLTSIMLSTRSADVQVVPIIFGAIAILASAGDFRMIRSGGIRGTARIVRHLWRMCFALWIAAGSFFLGQAKVIPKAIRIPALLAIPVVFVLVAMLYWLWRVRFSRSTSLRAYTAVAAVSERI